MAWGRSLARVSALIAAHFQREGRWRGVRLPVMASRVPAIAAILRLRAQRRASAGPEPASRRANSPTFRIHAENQEANPIFSIGALGAWRSQHPAQAPALTEALFPVHTVPGASRQVYRPPPEAGLSGRRSKSAVLVFRVRLPYGASPT